jgi:hypothetical protein
MVAAHTRSAAGDWCDWRDQQSGGQAMPAWLLDPVRDPPDLAK